MKKVLFITPKYYPRFYGGSEKSLKLLIDSLDKKKFEPIVLSFDGEKKIEKEFVEGVKVYRLKRMKISPNTLSQNLTLLFRKNLVKHISPEIIHVYNTWHMPASFFLKDKKTKVVATLNNYFPLCPIAYTKNNLIEQKDKSALNQFREIYQTLRYKPRILNFFIAVFYLVYGKISYFFSKRLDHYFSYSDGIKEIYVEWGFDKNKITTTGVFFEKHKLVGKNKRDRNTLLYSGGLSESKGIMELLEAIKILNNKDLKLIVLGKGDLENKAKSFVKKNNLNVEFRGMVSREEVLEKMQECSVFIHPSQWPDPFPRAWVEALQSDILIIVSDNPVAKKELKGAIFYKRGNAKDLSEKIDTFFKGKIKSNLEKDKKRILSNNPIKKIANYYGK